MTDLGKELDSILGHLSRIGRPVAEILQEPLDLKDIRAHLRDLQLCPSNALTDLYSWRNGTRIAQGDILNDLDFFPGFYYMSLDRALRAYDTWSKGQWNPAWFPIFANDCGDFYAVELSQEPIADGPVIGYIRGEPEQEVAFESLISMACTISACYEVGAYFVTAGGYLDVDDRAKMAIAKKFNPTLKQYKL
jgi:hypothetical protein